jgi:filamentous hemagglutinin
VPEWVDSAAAPRLFSKGEKSTSNTAQGNNVGPGGSATTRVGASASDNVTKRVDFNFLNKAGKFYPDIPDLRTGKSITFPTGNLQRVPKADRVPWGAQERGAFIKEWYDRGYKTPRGGWAEYDVHHIQPREFGGSNDFWNLTPIQRKTHQQEFNSFWRDM